MFMKKNSVYIKILFSLLSFFFFFGFVPSVLAHVLQTDGSIGAVLHLEPEDDPIIGQPAQFFFEFKDKDHKFSPKECECFVFVLQDGKEIYRQPLFDPVTLDTSFSYTFVQKGVYTIKVVGKPIVAHAFQPFSLTYDRRVTRESPDSVDPTTTASSLKDPRNWFLQHIVYVLGGGILLLLLFLMVLRTYLNKKKTVRR
jgi:hypothetical protein